MSRDRAEQHNSPYRYGSNSPVSRTDADGYADYESSEELLNVGKGMLGRAEFQAKGKTTFCNFATQYVVNPALKNKISGRANNIYDSFQDKNFATKVTAKQATKLANTGLTVVAAWKNPKGSTGHVAVVSPELDSRNRPKVFNIGPRKYSGHVSIAKAFGRNKRKSKNFGYYVLNEDLHSLSFRTNPFVVDLTESLLENSPHQEAVNKNPFVVDLLNDMTFTDVEVK